MGLAPDLHYRRTAIYGRVSTEHEAQLSALENQRDWYEQVAQQHPEWVIVERYFDEGITGTAAQKRPAFMQMLEGARQGKFDLIVTREVCRFARNTVDTLTVTRELSKLGVEVYFVSDNIRTMDGDGELRLTLMATLAQEESRKISERVRAGIQVCRNKGVLFGNGNILGYDLVDGNYVINAEQAYTVRKIFELYASGMGYKRICSELTGLGCKNAHGNVNWNIPGVGRILRNATYKGYICYNKSRSDGYLTQKRISNREEDYIYIKGNFEPIVSEALWDRCAELREKKSTNQRDENGRTVKFGKKAPKSVWVTKLRCSCGSALRRFEWRRPNGGRTAFGYECYRQKRNVSRRYLNSHGLDEMAVCTQKSIPDWHIELMAYMVFQTVWKERKDAVLLACQMIEECAVAETNSSEATIMGLKQKKAKLQKQIEGLRGMCALGDITREEFLKDNSRLQTNIRQIDSQIDELTSASTQVPTLDMKMIRETLDQWVDLSSPVVSESLVDQFILQVVITEKNTFNFTLDTSAASNEKKLMPSDVATRKHIEKVSNGRIDTGLSKHILDPQEIFSFQVTQADAKAYCEKIGMRFFAKKWENKKVIISI